METRDNYHHYQPHRHDRPTSPEEQVDSRGGSRAGGNGNALSQVLSHSSTVRSEEEMQRQGDQEGRRPSRRGRWFSAKTILGTFSVLFSLAMLGISIKMVAQYGDTGLVHVSFICVGFTAVSAIVWQTIEFMAMCARPDNRGLYPGAHVGVHICICLACVATMGYVGIWVSDGNHDWKYVDAPDEVEDVKVGYSPLYRMGIVLLILTVILLLLNFILAIIACQIVKRKDDAGAYRTVVTVRYDGVGPTGTDRPRSFNNHPASYMYTVRDAGAGANGLAVPPLVITRQDLGREVTDEPPRRSSVSPRPSEKASVGPGR